MKNHVYLVSIFFSLAACAGRIKEENVIIDIEEGTETNKTTSKKIFDIGVTESASIDTDSENEQHVLSEHSNLLGFWVGYFEKDDGQEYGDKGVYVDEGYYWTRENKINISIDEIRDSIVIGHSVVAGNDRPFNGIMKQTDGLSYSFDLKEPGDHKYDGRFEFTIKSGMLEGKWKAYKGIDIQNRKYSLEKKTFNYDPSIMLESSKAYVNWNKFIGEETTYEEDGEEFFEWIKKEFSSATDLIYEINASNKLLSKQEVENLDKGDLIVIRNTIYARHGYSFKNRPLRVFFDAQPWYIPVHTDIRNDFTEIEKKNIELLLKYEEHAKEYYDYFGRG